MIDHIIFLAPDLDRGCDDIESRLGTRPARAGRHPQWGTHNALLSIGPSTYLEVIAPDPDAAVPERGTLFGDHVTDETRLFTWVARCDPLDSARDAAVEAGADIGPIAPGSRLRPDGSRIEWRLTDPAALPFDGVVPFLIAWGESEHPATTTPPAGRLVRFELVHPKAESVRSVLAAIGSDVDVTAGPTPALSAEIETRGGRVTLSN